MRNTRVKKNFSKTQEYFFSEIVETGKLLYHTGRVSLAEMRALSPEEYTELMQEDFNYWRDEAEGFFQLYESAMDKGLFRHAAFNLHQVVECSCVMVELIYTRYRSKIHDLNKLLEKMQPFVREMAQIFPKDTEFQKQAYKRLYKAYVSARYHKDYTIEEDELTYLGERVKMLLELAIRNCEERIRHIPKELKKGAP